MIVTAASVTANKPLAGYKADAYVIFDYFSPTDFKYAGVDISTNKFVLGHRDASGWIQDAFSPAQLKPDTAYELLVQVNGTAVYVNVGSKTFSYLYGPRVLDGENVGLNKGLIGVGSQQAKGTYDNVTIQVAKPQMTLDTLEDYNDGVAQLYTGATTGTWSVSNGRYVATPVAGATSVATKDADLGRAISVDSYLEVSTALQTTTTAGIVFDQYAANDLKFVMLDVSTQRVLVGHIDPRRGYIVETSVAKTLLANTDYQLSLTLKGASVAVTVNGSYVTTWGFNAAVVDGRFGLITRGAQASFDNTRIRTNDRAFAAPGGALTADVEATSSEGAPRLDEAALVPVVADAQRAWIASGADPSAFDDVRVAVADLSDRQLGQTVGRTIYIDATAAGYGWAYVDLFEVIEHELGHVLGYTHEDAEALAVMHPSMAVTALTAALPRPGIVTTGNEIPLPVVAASASVVSRPWALGLLSVVLGTSPARVEVARSLASSTVFASASKLAETRWLRSQTLPSVSITFVALSASIETLQFRGARRAVGPR